MRVVSLDVCADQYVVRLLERERILAVSPDATAPFSHMRTAARGLPTVRPLAEDALVLQPDLIVRSYGGGTGATALFQRAGIPVLQVGWASDLDGVRRVVTDMGKGLGAQDAASNVLDEMDARLAELRQTGSKTGAQTRTLYLTPSGTTTGPGSLIDALLQEAGLTNAETRPGWHSVSLEDLLRDAPDLVATAYFDDPLNQRDAWSLVSHPVARDRLSRAVTVDLDRAWVSCGSWSALDAVEHLNRAAP